MPDLSAGFQSLPADYQAVIRLAQKRLGITVAPLQLLAGGWSGASVYLVSVGAAGGRVEHYVLKLDRKSEKSRSDEIDRFQSALRLSPPDFASRHIAQMAFERVEHEGIIAIFYAVAGQSLSDYRTLSAYDKQNELELIFAETCRQLLDGWNAARTFKQAVHPQALLERWLAFRIKPGNQIEQYLENVRHLPSGLPGFLIHGRVFPNPLVYARDPQPWGATRPIDAAFGLQHGDLNANNVLVKFARGGQALDGFYLIDFALFKEEMPLLYDLRYLEMSYFTFRQAQVSYLKLLDLIAQSGEADRLDPQHMPIDVAGVGAVVDASREAFDRWVRETHSSLHDDLWGQYWLAGAAAGLAYCHKPALADAERLTGLVYAAANLKRYMTRFGLPMPSEGQQLFGPAGGAPRSGTAGTGSPAPERTPHNLPAQSTPFIGRESISAELKNLLLDPAVRLVTLLGPGGTGKTRLSLQIACDVLADFPHGVFFVPLADDIDAGQFVSRVALQIEVREGGRPLLASVKDFLRDKQLLLVLDNFEQLVAAALVVAELLAAAPRVKFMVSSRVALRLQAEREFPVPPLELPAAESDPSPEALAGSEAVRLFVERARAVQPAFALSPANAASVAEICRRVDGLPLALELAAARIKLLPPAAILTRLDDRLKLLTGGARDLPARHQTLRGTLEWSYGLLNPEEKALYARLSVFVGGFSLEAAEAVCNPEGRFDILAGVEALAGNSLLRREDTAEGEPRFGMLETIRAHAVEQLAASGDLETLRRQHAGYFAGLILSQAGPQLYSPNAPQWLGWLDRELDNVRATLTWSLTDPQGIEMGSGLIFALSWYWYRRGTVLEGRGWADKMLASPLLKPGLQARVPALLGSGMLSVWVGNQELALAHLQEALALEQRFEDEHLMAPALLGNGVALVNMGRDGPAHIVLEQARDLFKEQGETYFHALTLVHMGNVALGLGQFDEARTLLKTAETQARSLGETWALSFALNNLGEVARTQGYFDLARGYYLESEALLRSANDHGDLVRLIHNLGYIAQHEGDYARAAAQFRKSLALFRRLGNRRGLAECMAGLAGLRARQGQPEWGAVMLSAAEAVLKATGGAWWPADRREVEENWAIIQAALSEPELAAAQARGKAMSLEQALAFVTDGG